MGKVNNIKNITVEYYYVCSFVESENDKKTAVSAKIEISYLLKKLCGIEIQKRTVNYNGEQIILSDINYNHKSGLWELVFFKSRSATVPFIISSSGKARQIILENDEMISEVLCAEYDPKSKVLAMQRNVYAFGAKGLDIFFSSFTKNSLFLESIQTLNEEKRKLFKKSKLKKFKLHVKNTIPNKKTNDYSNTFPQYNKNTSICKVIDAALAMNSAVINIEFSVANSSKTLDVVDEDFEIFQELMNNSNVKCLELGLAADEYSSMQVTDFMDFRIKDTISVPFTKGHPINISDILEKMAVKFKENIYL